MLNFAYAFTITDAHKYYDYVYVFISSILPLSMSCWKSGATSVHSASLVCTCWYNRELKCFIILTSIKKIFTVDIF